MINFNTKTLSSNPSYTVKKNLFSVEECEAISKLFNQVQPSLTGGGMNQSKRDSANIWIPFTEGWLYERVAMASKECNPWEFDLSGFHEQFQLTFYKQDSHYGWHQDSGSGAMSVRKLSAVVQLSNPNSYQGGHLEFFGSQLDELREQGSITFFPSYSWHRVTPVLEGFRFSLVIWMSGPPFR
jgi:PKHD-type hydroxylase